MFLPILGRVLELQSVLQVVMRLLPNLGSENWLLFYEYR
jgi:hypothetical protein